VRTFPRFTVPYFQPLPPHFSHFAVSSFFDQCTGGELLVNCRWSECDQADTLILCSRAVPELLQGSMAKHELGRVSPWGKAGARQTKMSQAKANPALG